MRTLRVSRVTVDFLPAQDSWVFLPERVEFDISNDGVTWNTVYHTIVALDSNSTLGAVEIGAEIDPQAVRYIRVRAENRVCPDWGMCFGNAAWILVDEILVEGVQSDQDD